MIVDASVVLGSQGSPALGSLAAALPDTHRSDTYPGEATPPQPSALK
jgi:hypothetical protein